MTDIYLLAESDSLVCTFSSGFCRVAYELMQARHARGGNDATRKAVSIDVPYFYAYVPFPARRTLFENSGATDKKTNRTQSGILIQSKRDFKLSSARMTKNYADGFSTTVGKISSTKHQDIISPRFKTLDVYSLACYAAFNETTQIM
ncbi:hypothetical protein MTO96_046668 [Rhipicephalus appendiculatus]